MIWQNLHNFRVLLIILIAIFLSACEETPSIYEPKYSELPSLTTQKTFIIGIHPLHNPSKLYEVFNPLAEYLTQNIPTAKFKIEASKDYAAFDKKINNQSLDFLLPNPYQTLNAIKHNYQVTNQMGPDDSFRGIILVRKDKNIKNILQLKDKAIAYPAPTALAATMMPQYYLQSHGLNIKSETKTLYVGSQESSILNVYTKRTSAAATWTIPWLDLQKNQPDIAQDLEILIETDSLPSNSFMFHTSKVNIEVAESVQYLLSNLHLNAEGRLLLQKMNIIKVFSANNETYEPVSDFMVKFKNTVGDNTWFEKK